MAVDPKELPGAVQLALRGQTPTLTETLTNPPAPTATDTSAASSAGPTALGGGATIGDTQNPDFWNTLRTNVANQKPQYNDRLSSALDEHAKTQPAAVAQPGGWARTLVAAGAKALSGAVTAFGDVAAVGTVPSGAGGLTGAARVAQATTQRKRQTQLDIQEAAKNNALIAEANARTRHTQSLIHQLGNEQLSQGVASGQGVIEKMREVAPDFEVISGLDSDELALAIKSGKIKPGQQKGILTGMKPVGVDENGVPQYRGTYSIVIPHDVDLDPSKPKDKAVLDWLNKYSPPKPGQTWQGDGGKAVHLQGDQFLALATQADLAEAATMARNKVLVDRKAATQDQAQKLEAITFKENINDWVTQLAHTPKQDPIAARNRILRDPALAAKWPNLDNDLREYYGAKEFDSMLTDYQKKIDTRMETITDLEKQTLKAHGEEAAGLAQVIQGKINDPEWLDERPRLIRLLDQANASAQASLDYDKKKEENRQRAETAAIEQDIPTLVDMARQYQMDPKDMAGLRKDTRSKLLAALHTADPTWSEPEYRKRYQTAQDFRAEGKGGLMVQSLNYFGGHLGAAEELIGGLHNTNSKYLNMPLNLIKGAGAPGEAAIGRYKIALKAAKNEYENFLLNQHAEHEIDKQAMDKLLDENTTPAAAESILKQMAHTVAVRAASLNARYKNDLKQNIPDFIEPENQRIFRLFGIDPQKQILQGQGRPNLNLPQPDPGNVWITTPAGTPMQLPSSKVPTAVANGATVVTQ